MQHWRRQMPLMQVLAATAKVQLARLALHFDHLCARHLLCLLAEYSVKLRISAHRGRHFRLMVDGISA